MYPIPATESLTRIIIALTQWYRARFPMNQPILVRRRTDCCSHSLSRRYSGPNCLSSLRGVIPRRHCET